MGTSSVSVCSTCWIKHVLRWLNPLKKNTKPSLQTGSSQHLAQCHAEHRTDRRRSARTPGWDWMSCSALVFPPQTTPPRTPDCAPATGETNRTKMITRTNKNKNKNKSQKKLLFFCPFSFPFHKDHTTCHQSHFRGLCCV